MSRIGGDLRQLEGTWIVTSLEVDGAPLAASAFGQARIEIGDAQAHGDASST